MNRQLFGLMAASMIVTTASAVTFHSGTSFGSMVGDPNDLTVESWDFGLNMEDPDEWRFSAFEASIAAGLTDRYAFNVRNVELAPPTNPVADIDAFSTFFSTAQQYPNNLDFSGLPTYINDSGAANGRLIQAAWSAGSVEDGIGPSFVLFRLSITRGTNDLPLTLTPGPGSELVASINGSSNTLFDGDVPFAFNLYTVPEPATLALLAGGLLLITRRKAL